MPIIESNNYTCFLCNSKANFISFNSKKYRCTEKITQCPGFIQRAEQTRKDKFTHAERIQHMKSIGEKGNSKLKTLHQDKEWRDRKGKNITRSKVKNGSALDPSQKTEWGLYEDAVDRVTRDSWTYYRNIINPTNLIRGGLYELDHKFSKKEGFLNNIPPEVIGHYSNLSLIERSSNRRKYSKSSVSIDTLYVEYHSTIPSDSPSSDTTIS